MGWLRALAQWLRKPSKSVKKTTAPLRNDWPDTSYQAYQTYCRERGEVTLENLQNQNGDVLSQDLWNRALTNFWEQGFPILESDFLTREFPIPALNRRADIQVRHISSQPIRLSEFDPSVKEEESAPESTVPPPWDELKED